MCTRCIELKDIALDHPDMVTDVVLTGDYYGYPRCCSFEFAIIMITFTQSRLPVQNDLKVHQGFGFIPCAEHSKDILAGKITLESLIQHRVCSHNFPIQGSTKAMETWVRNKMDGLNTKRFVEELIETFKQKS